MEKEVGLVDEEDHPGELEIVDAEVMNIIDKTVNAALKGRELKFWEVYVDQGSLASHIARKYPDATVSTFSLPEWDFSREGQEIP